MVNLMDGRKLANEIKGRVKKSVDDLNKSGIDVGLALLLVGQQPASLQYFLAILKAGRKAGIIVHEYRLSATASLNEILNAVHSINGDERIHGLLALLPLPKRINPRRVVNAITPEKDIDGLGSISVGRLAAEESTIQIFARERQPYVPSFLPCTPYGVIRLLEHYGVEIKGKNAVVVGKSLAVGKPLSIMLLAKEATVTVCHKSTQDLKGHLRGADIVCTATGVSGLIRGDMIKEGAVVVDIGINVLPDGKVTGDVDFDSAAPKASFITPVPGGVGPVTIAMLLENAVRSAQRHELFNSPFTPV